MRNTEEGGRRRGRREGVGERELWSRGGWRGRIKVRGELANIKSGTK